MRRSRTGNNVLAGVEWTRGDARGCGCHRTRSDITRHVIKGEEGGVGREKQGRGVGEEGGEKNFPTSQNIVLIVFLVAKTKVLIIFHVLKSLDKRYHALNNFRRGPNHAIHYSKLVKDTKGNAYSFTGAKPRQRLDLGKP